MVTTYVIYKKNIAFRSRLKAANKLVNNVAKLITKKTFNTALMFSKSFYVGFCEVIYINFVINWVDTSNYWFYIANFFPLDL